MIKIFNFIKKNKIIFYLKKQNQGILMMISASILFSLMAIIIKSLRDFPLMEVVFFRSFPAVLVLPLIIRKSKLNFLGVNKYLLLARSSFGICFYIHEYELNRCHGYTSVKPIFYSLFISYFFERKG